MKAGTLVKTPNGYAVVLESPIFKHSILVRHENGATWTYDPSEVEMVVSPFVRRAMARELPGKVVA